MKSFLLPAIALAFGVLHAVAGTSPANATVTRLELGDFGMQSPSLVKVYWRRWGYWRRPHWRRYGYWHRPYWRRYGYWRRPYWRRYGYWHRPYWRRYGYWRRPYWRRYG
jgi:hypothetical protein